MPHPPFRLQPVGPAGAYQTYSVRAPLPTHWRKATCGEVDCANYRQGWRTILPTGSDHVAFIRSGGTGRRFTERDGGPGLIQFVFPPGQPCFKADAHRLPLERDPLYTVRGGDWRQNLGVIRRHTRPADFVEDFAGHQQAIAERHKRG